MKKNLFIFILLGILGLGLFVALYNKTYPTAAVDLQITKEKAVESSENFLKAFGFNLRNFTPTVVFSSSNTQVLYLQSVIGIKETNQFIRRDNFLWFWSVRWFRELEKEEFWVDINPKTGKVEGFSHEILAEAEGDNPSTEQANSSAGKFLINLGYNLENWQQVDASEEKQKNRTDHHFEWERKNYKVGEAALRVAVGILGGRIGSFYRYLKIPEQFNREYQKRRSYGVVLSLISSLLTIFIFLSALVSLIILIKRNEYFWRFAFYAAWCVAIFALFEFFNALPLLWYSYDTTMSKAVFFNITFLSSLIGTVIFWLVVFFIGAVGYSLSLQCFRDNKLPILMSVKEGNFSFQKSQGLFVGYLISFFLLGLVALLYYFGTKYWGVWMPMGSKYSNMLGTHFPWLYPLTLGATAAVSEELIFRLFAISLIKKYLKNDLLAVLLPALIWAFAHSNYEVFPAYMRGIELTIVGIVMGYLFLKFGLETVIIAHYSFNAIIASVPLLESKNLFYQTGGIVVIFLVFIPFLFIFLIKRFKKSPASVL